MINVNVYNQNTEKPEKLIKEGLDFKINQQGLGDDYSVLESSALRACTVASKS